MKEMFDGGLLFLHLDRKMSRQTGNLENRAEFNVNLYLRFSTHEAFGDSRIIFFSKIAYNFYKIILKPLRTVCQDK